MIKLTLTPRLGTDVELVPGCCCHLVTANFLSSFSESFLWPEALVGFLSSCSERVFLDGPLVHAELVDEGVLFRWTTGEADRAEDCVAWPKI